MLWNLKYPVSLCSCKVTFSTLPRRENSGFSVRSPGDGRIVLVEIMLWRSTGIPGWIGQISGEQVTACHYLLRHWPARFRSNERGINSALYELELQRIELIKFNLFDNSGTYQAYVTGRDGRAGPVLQVWPEMQLPPTHPRYKDVEHNQEHQVCSGELIRFRTVTGICNDIYNPLMGSTHQIFARNVQFDTTFPDLGLDEMARNRHGDRLGLLKPDPQVISRKLFTRTQSQPDKCRNDDELSGDLEKFACDYKKHRP